MNFGNFGLGILVVVILLGFVVEIVKIKQRLAKLEGQARK
jgi:hypothetical protein